MRLFMSVDLMGSTAFKAMEKYSNPENGSKHPQWVSVFRTFYQEFPSILKKSFDRVCRTDANEELTDGGNHPKVWKTVGDEIVFCNRIKNIDHAAVCVSAFVKALDEYSSILKKSDLPLNVKGAGWIAAFPAPNISISVFSNDKIMESVELELAISPSQDDAIIGIEEALEIRADDEPHNYDFLGKGIDTGFRIAKNATEDRMVVSAQLGYILARASSKKLFGHVLGYHGRESLKGVVNGNPYPVISIDTERSELQSKLKSREANLTGQKPISPFVLFDFLETYLEAAAIESPYVCFKDEKLNDMPQPQSYINYSRVFNESVEADTRRLKDVVKSDDIELQNAVALDVLDASVEFLKKFPSDNAYFEVDGNTSQEEAP